MYKRQGQIGALSGTVHSILTRIREGSEPLRIGIPKSPNSVLHAILTALESEDYINATDQEAYVQWLRHHILTEIRPEIFKQELYDMSPEAIARVWEEEEDGA